MKSSITNLWVIKRKVGTDRLPGKVLKLQLNRKETVFPGQNLMCMLLVV